MKFSIAFIALIFCSGITFGQIDFDEHIKSIKDHYYEVDDENGSFNAHERSVTYALKYLESSGVEQKFVTNRNLLVKLENLECTDSLGVSYSKALDNGKQIEVKATYGKYNPEIHTVEKIDNLPYIDGKIAFGAYYGDPGLEISSLQIMVDGIQLDIPRSCYANFYNPWQCRTITSVRPLEAFTSEDGEFIFVYIWGGLAADSYFAKLIFDKNGYVTQIVADYVQLSRWGAFSKDFIGF